MLTIATFNVKDLFDAVHDEKIATLAARIAEADPDILGMQEVGSPAALDAILARLPRGAEYTTRLVAPADKRGIANALIARVPLMASWVHTAEELPLPVFVEGDAPPFAGRIRLRRPMPHGRFAVPGLGAVDVLVAHWKSQRGTLLRRADGSEIEPTSAGEWGRSRRTRADITRRRGALRSGLLEKTQKKIHWWRWSAISTT